MTTERAVHFRLLHGVPSSPGLTGLREVVVRTGDRVTVAGTLVRELADGSAGHELGFRDAVVVTRIVGDDEHPVLISAR